MRAFLWGRKMPLPSVEQFIGTNVTEQGFKDAQKQLVEYVGNEVPKKIDTDAAFATKADKATTLAGYGIADTYTKSQVDASITAVSGGHKAYQTLAQAAQATLPVSSIVEITNDGANNGTYQWNGTTLTKSAYDPLTQAKADATTKANAAEVNAKNYTDSKTPTNHISKGPVFGITDTSGNSILNLDEKGNLKAPAIHDAKGVISSELQAKESISPYAYSIADQNGNPILKIRNDGTLVVESVEDKNGVVGSSGVPLDKIFNNISQLDIFINHGQSNGSGGVTITVPPVTNTPQFNNVLLDNGTIVDLVIAADQPERPGYNLVNHLTRVTERDTSLETSNLSSKNGVFSIAQSGTGIVTLYNDVGAYKTCSDWLTNIKSYCDANGITCNVKAMLFTHGEADTATMTVDEYLGHQYALYNKFNTKIKQITGQKNDMKFLTWKLDNLSAGKAQLKAYYQHPSMIIAFPKYCGYFADGAHFNSVGSALAGAYYALAYRYVFEQGKDWQPLMHTNIKKYGINAVKVAYTRKGLTFDNSRFDATGGGFYGSDASGALTVITHEVNNFGDVVITFNRDIVGDLTFGYGRQLVRTDAGNNFGGTLRDNDGLFEKTLISGTEYPLHNWALTFEEVVK